MTNDEDMAVVVAGDKSVSGSTSNTTMGWRHQKRKRNEGYLDLERNIGAAISATSDNLSSLLDAEAATTTVAQVPAARDKNVALGMLL